MRWIHAISLTAFLAVFLTIDASGDFPSLEGPGITIDESFNVDVGWYLVKAQSIYGLAALAPQSQMEIFSGENNYNPDHPPFGRVLLGISDALFGSLVNPSPGDDEPTRWSISAARPAAGLAYAATVWLCGFATLRVTGGDALAGAAAATLFATTPRVFGHAHMASLESFIGLTFAASTFYLAWRWSRGPTWCSGAIGGLLWGLALLTKIQAVLLPIPLTVWAFWYYRSRAWVPLSLVAVVGMATFFVGWPWLWASPFDSVLEYFGRGADRLSLNVFFAGQTYTDRTVPVLYTATMVVVCMPLPMLLTALWGGREAAREQDERARRYWAFLSGVIGFTVLFFSIPSIAVYDGVRLFLICFPFIACFAGLGFAKIWRLFASRQGQFVNGNLHRPTAGAALVVASFGWLLATGPCWLSHYSALVGGLPGAVRLGFEADYWAASVTSGFWNRVADEVPENSTIALTPELHQFQLDTLADQVPLIRQRGYRLVSYPKDAGDDTGTATVEPRFVIAFRRRADLASELSARFSTLQSVIASELRFGVPLAICIDRQRRANGDTTD